MNEPKDVVFKLEGSTLSLEVDIREGRLIDAILSALIRPCMGDVFGPPP